jgi:hypothetical protein
MAGLALDAVSDLHYDADGLEIGQSTIRGLCLNDAIEGLSRKASDATTSSV